MSLEQLLQRRTADGVREVKELAAAGRAAEAQSNRSTTGLVGLTLSPKWKFWISRHARRGALIGLGDRHASIVGDPLQLRSSVEAVVNAIIVEKTDALSRRIAISSLARLTAREPGLEARDRTAISKPLLDAIRMNPLAEAAPVILRAIGVLNPVVDASESKLLVEYLRAQPRNNPDMRILVWGAYACCAAGADVPTHLGVLGTVLTEDELGKAVAVATSVPLITGTELQAALLEGAFTPDEDLIDVKKLSRQLAVSPNPNLLRREMKMLAHGGAFDDGVAKANRHVQESLARHVAQEVARSKLEALEAIALLRSKASPLAGLLHSMALGELRPKVKVALAIATAALGVGVGGDPAAEAKRTIGAAREQASKSRRRVLVEVGGPWCKWSLTMEQFFESRPEMKRLRDDNYVLARVDILAGQDLNQTFPGFPSFQSVPHLFVVDSDGTVLHSQITDELEAGNTYDEAKFGAFLRKWAPTMPS